MRVLRVYPRVCGGTATIAFRVPGGMGLSPRVRGNLPRKYLRILRHGSIPACAGEPRLYRRYEWHSKVYPRVCGGTFTRRRYRQRIAGLSPRVRGNQYPTRYCPSGQGSIPACAGEPGQCRRWDFLAPVYPRVCGGTHSPSQIATADQGLSPRVRGNHRLRFSQSSGVGSIPACAGEPGGGLRQPDRPVVYPRVCGGTRRELTNMLVGAGLSPRVRGNPVRTALRCIPCGSIPACAGEPFVVVQELAKYPVYPRVCGGTRSRVSSAPMFWGLSPRVRGNP